MRRFLDPFLMEGLVVFAALRVVWFNGKLPLDRLVETLRTTRELPPRLRRPEAFQGIVNRRYRWLPPYDLRACLKRSYLLLDLWSRCGLEPQFHIGLRKIDGEPDGHAWVSADGLDGGEMSSEGYKEAFVA